MATITTKKIDDYTLEVTKTDDPLVSKVNHELKFLKSQKIAIKAQRDAFVAARNVEIAEVDDIIQRMISANIIERTAEIIKPII